MSDPIRPEDKQRMSPIMEYCRILFDTHSYDFTIEYYDRENYRQEKHENLTLEKVAEMRDVLVREESVGRRLDFLMQELNREANTLSSKSGDIETTQAAVDLKVAIEQMREQIQNIE